jgi:hypothetical protein
LVIMSIPFFRMWAIAHILMFTLKTRYKSS